MTLKKIIKEVINELPSYLKSDVDFKSLVSILNEFLNQVMEDECYLTLSKKRYYDSFKDVDLVKNFNDSNIVMSISFENNDYFFSFAIYDLKSMGFGVDLSRSNHGDIVTQTAASLTKSETKSTLKVETSTFSDAYYFDYNVDIKRFDSNHKLDKTYDAERKKDEIFSDKFFVPIELSRLMRLNFKRFQKQINEARLKGQVETNNEIERTQGYLFSSPFRLGDIDSFIKNDFLESFGNESDEVLYEAIPSEDIDDEIADPLLEEDLSEINVDSDKLESILSVLTNYIGIDEQVVFSDSIINDLITYFSSEMVSSLNTSGVMIKRDGDNFILYKLWVNNGIFTIFPKFITLEELKEIYLKNTLNQDVKGLEEFFDIRGR